jgi:hypothetical protein
MKHRIFSPIESLNEEKLQGVSINAQFSFISKGNMRGKVTEDEQI